MPHWAGKNVKMAVVIIKIVNIVIISYHIYTYTELDNAPRTPSCGIVTYCYVIPTRHFVISAFYVVTGAREEF